MSGQAPSSEHYKKLAIEPLTVILANGYDFVRGNALKYIMRAGYKEGENLLEDLEKALWYVKLMIKLAEEERERERDESAG